MTQEKLRRVVTASVVAGTTLFVFLLSVLIYQIATIAVYNKRTTKIEQEIKELEQSVEDNESLLAHYSSDLGMFWLATEEGFISGQR